MSGATTPRVVWVVDDSQLDAERARRVLARDHTVRVFHDGSAALEALSSEHRPDVLVLDWVMPGISGVDVCRFLRSRMMRSEDISILLLTAHRQTEQIVEGLRAGANDYLAKPYADEELVARVATLLRALDLVRRAERAENENRRLLENTPDPLIVLDAERKLCFVNQVACIAFDRAPHLLLGLPLAEVLPDFTLMLPRRPGDTSPPQSDLTLGGRVFSPSVRFMSDEDGRISILLRDVTERRLLDERRLDFYSMIAHDLRTPLSSIALRVHLMQRDQQVTSAPALTRGVQQIDRNLGDLVTMINDFLELATLDNAIHRLERGEVDVVKLLEQAAEELEPLISAKRHTWSIAADACDAPHVTGDPKRLYQVITNLLANAIKFTPEGGTISARVQVDPHEVRITISDNGSGIHPDVAPTLFQRYQRADKSVAGTGLGLLIVREIVEAHGGSVGVDSKPGEGARFWFTLPCTHAEARGRAHELSEPRHA